MMNLLIDTLPTSISVKGVEVSINSDFRASIAYSLIAATDIDPSEKGMLALSVYTPQIDPNLVCEELFERFNEFFQGGKTEAKKRQESKLKGMGNGKEGYSFELDADLIHAAFLSQYQIDLNDIEYLHWFKFMSLFGGLNETNEIVKIIGYRTMKIDSNMSADQRKHYKNLQKRYALPTRQKTREVSEIEQKLVAGTYRE